MKKVSGAPPHWVCPWNEAHCAHQPRDRHFAIWFEVLRKVPPCPRPTATDDAFFSSRWQWQELFIRKKGVHMSKQNRSFPCQFSLMAESWMKLFTSSCLIEKGDTSANHKAAAAPPRGERSSQRRQLFSMPRMAVQKCPLGPQKRRQPDLLSRLHAKLW